MALNVTHEVAALQRMTVKELRAKFADVCGDETRSGNRAWLIKRIAWRMQANHEGGLTERARQRAWELACDPDLRQDGSPGPRTPDFRSGWIGGGRFCTFHRCLWCPISCASTAAGVSHVATGHYHSHFKSIDGNWRFNFYGVLRTERVE
jgi:hypothetical protein